MGAWDLPLEVRRRIESKWSARLKRMKEQSGRRIHDEMRELDHDPSAGRDTGISATAAIHEGTWQTKPKIESGRGESCEMGLATSDEGGFCR